MVEKKAVSSTDIFSEAKITAFVLLIREPKQCVEQLSTEFPLSFASFSHHAEQDCQFHSLVMIARLAKTVQLLSDLAEISPLIRGNDLIAELSDQFRRVIGVDQRSDRVGINGGPVHLIRRKRLEWRSAQPVNIFKDPDDISVISQRRGKDRLSCIACLLVHLSVKC